ncbi:MAG: heavy metal translocating P-type ATPase, partial [Inhella sp.]
GVEARGKGATGGGVGGVEALRPPTVVVVRQGKWHGLPLAGLEVGDTVRLSPGQRVPCDGVVTAGRTHVNEAHLSGEPLPQAREPGQPVRAGSLNLDGAIEIRASALPAASSLAQLVRLVESAQASKAPIQRLADTWSARFVPAVLGLSLLTLLGWLLAGRPEAAVLNAVAVLVVACPCALGLATPAAVVVGLGQAALRGLVVRDAGAFEALARVQRVAFDKTGTLTQGEPQLVQVEAVAPLSRLEVQALALSLAQGSEHPLARAMRRAQEGVPLAVAVNLRALPGLGVQAEVDGRTLHLGSSRHMAELGVSTTALDASSLALAERGCSLSWLATTTPQPALLGLLAFADAPRPQAREALARLQKQGLTLSLLSGDRPESARAVGLALGLSPDEVHGGLLPADKLSSLASWRLRGERVAMVGDGLNDAPALAAADVGIAMAPPG